MLPLWATETAAIGIGTRLCADLQSGCNWNRVTRRGVSLIMVSCIIGGADSAVSLMVFLGVSLAASLAVSLAVFLLDDPGLGEKTPEETRHKTRPY